MIQNKLLQTQDLIFKMTKIIGDKNFEETSTSEVVMGSIFLDESDNKIKKYDANGIREL